MRILRRDAFPMFSNHSVVNTRTNLFDVSIDSLAFNLLRKVVHQTVTRYLNLFGFFVVVLFVSYNNVLLSGEGIQRKVVLIYAQPTTTTINNNKQVFEPLPRSQ